MHKFISAGALGLILLSGSASAQKADDKGLESSSANQSAMQSSQTTASELSDGSKIEITATGMVMVFNKDTNTKTPAPDGTLTLKDGTTLTVKDGKKV